MMQKVWMVNDIGGCVDVTSMYLYIRFSHSRDKCYKIDAEKLLQLLTSMTDEFVLGELTFIPMNIPDIGSVIGVLAEGSKADKDQAVVYKNELKEALYFWVG